MKRPIKENFLKVVGREPETLNQLAESVIRVLDATLLDNSRSREVNRVLGFSWDVVYNEHVSNSHSSPEGKPENFMNKPGWPRSYPGWQGRVWIRFASRPSGFSSHWFKRTLTHPGTGGSGAYSGPWQPLSSAMFREYGHTDQNVVSDNIFSWDYKIFKEDWPKISEWVDQQITWSNLTGKLFPSRHIFTWTDPETLEKDTEFLKNLCYNNN